MRCSKKKLTVYVFQIIIKLLKQTVLNFKLDDTKKNLAVKKSYCCEKIADGLLVRGFTLTANKQIRDFR